jgi:hypothetical protein
MMKSIVKLTPLCIAASLALWAPSGWAMHHGEHDMDHDGGPSPEEFMAALKECGADAQTMQKAKDIMKQHGGPPDEKTGDAFMRSLDPSVAECMHSKGKHE